MKKLLALLLVLVVGGVALAAFVAWWVERPFRGYDGAEQFVDVAPGTGPASIGRQLVEAGVVRDELTWRAALMRTGAARDLKAGEYRFTDARSARDVVQMLARGEVFLRPITFREGLTIAEKARVFEERGFGSADAFIAAASDPSAIKDLDPEAPDLEGYLFPETYGLPRRGNAPMLVRAMVGRFRSVFDESLRKEAEARGLTVRQVVTLASLVEKETAVPDERPTVSAVYQNRLRINMLLQCDPTVIYALERDGKYDGNLTRAGLAYDSPYNTYRYPGLPPGPIAAPGRASIEAVLRPADVDYLFFVSRNDGSHIFSRTYAEHRKYVQEYQVEYFRRQRAEQRRAAAAGER
jgi:UPF0755 protein